MARYFVLPVGQDQVLMTILLQIKIEETTLDAAKSSIVYGVAKGVSTSGRAVRSSQPLAVQPILTAFTQ